MERRLDFAPGFSRAVGPNSSKGKITDSRDMQDPLDRRRCQRMQEFSQTSRGREALHSLGVNRTGPRGLFAEQQRHFMPRVGQTPRQFDAQATCGEVGQPPDLVKGFKRGARCDDAIHKPRGSGFNR